jgi:hypothetical protein
MTGPTQTFIGVSTARDGSAFSGLGASCPLAQFWLYCVEQP